MPIPRLYIDAELASGRSLALPETAFRHAVQVLRLDAGAPLLLFDGRGGEFDAVLQTVARREAVAHVLGRREVQRESPLAITLLQGVSKGERMDFAVQKAVELGVVRVVPVLTERCNVRLDTQRWEKKIEHWRGVAIAACEQCGRARLPEVAPVARLGAALEALPADLARLTLDPEAPHRLRELPPSSSAALLVGPEGGLAEADLLQADRAGFSRVRLGARILRTETAALAALAALQALWGDLG
jgi:16S rRNA (uracil1498-N3)-methyltransferase